MYLESENDLAWKWAERAYERCQKLIKGKDIKKSVCGTLQTVVEDSFDVMVKYFLIQLVLTDLGSKHDECYW